MYNPEFNYGLEGWTESGGGAKREVRSKGGNKFIVLHDRTKSFDSLLHNVQLQKSNIYSFSGKKTFSLFRLQLMGLNRVIYF